MGLFSKDITCLVLPVKGVCGELVDGADEKKEMGNRLVWNFDCFTFFYNPGGM